MGWHHSLTHRQYETWNAWLEMQWDIPSRTDHYIMQVSQDVRRVLAKDPNRIKLEGCRLKFRTARESTQATAPPLTVEQRTKIAQSQWFALTGFKPENQDPPNDNGE